MASERTPQRLSYQIQPISPTDDDRICDIIQSVGREFGAIGDGFGPSDAEVAAMSQHYALADKAGYFVAVSTEQCRDGGSWGGESWGGEKHEQKVLGGAGIAAFNGAEHICELRKLFLLPQYRGQGIGQALTIACLEQAVQWGFQQCYLDTLSNMTVAIELYKKLGFEVLSQPLAGTIHNGCDVWMLKKL